MGRYDLQNSGCNQTAAFLRALALALCLTPGLPNAATLSAGDSHTVAVKNDGTVWAWGNNSAGQLGDGGTARSSMPLQVPGLSAVAGIAAGGYHNCALGTAGSVKCWGNSSSGQLGDGSTTQRLMPVSGRPPA